MLNGLLGPAAGPSEVSALFSDEALVRAGVRFELALAHACAAEGFVGPEELQAIEAAAHSFDLDVGAIVTAAHHAGTLAIPLVARLKAAAGGVRDGAQDKVHLGSTSQDLADTVCALQCRQAATFLIASGHGLCTTLAQLAKQHVATPMVGRTLTRRALPITFGLKAATWLSGLSEALQRLARDADGLSVQFGGAVGALTGLGERGLAVADRVADELGLASAGFPWHTNRQRFIALGSSIALVAMALGKIAQDVALLGHDEIGELVERSPPGRGGSSAMPHKNNPTGSQQALLAVGRVKSLAQSLLSIPEQEYERSLQGWQSQLGTLAELLSWAAEAETQVTRFIDGLEVNAETMRRNLEAAGVGEDSGASQALVARAIDLHRKSGL
jgi:3-carboxy-cis,cis-muconate cycloisomerase